jgi:serralysin
MPLSRAIKPFSSSSSLDQDIDGLLSGFAWYGSQITYSFPNSASDYGKAYNGFTPFTPVQQDAVTSALSGGVYDPANGFFETGSFGGISSFASLQFVLVPYGSSNDSSALMRFASAKSVSDAYSNYPSEKDTGGDSWFSLNGYYSRPVPGSGGYAGILHEIGHDVGLKHSFENSGFGTVPANHNSLEYTVMSYSSFVGAKDWYGDPNGGDYPQTMMMDDIAALQYMYGANLSTHAGNTRYSWNPSTGALTITESGANTKPETFDAPTNKIFMTVWDPGGDNTFDFSSFKSGLNIDLQPGHWISARTDFSQTADLDALQAPGTHMAAGMIANALIYTDAQGVQHGFIQNAIGSTGDDVFTANAVKNVFTGNGGADTFVWLAASDLLNGAPKGTTVQDRITDFAAGDVVDLSKVHASNVNVTTTPIAGTSTSATTVTGTVTAADGSLQNFALELDGTFSHTDGAVHGNLAWLLLA